MTASASGGLAETFLQQILRGVVAPAAAQAFQNVTGAAPVQAAILQAQEAARKAEILAYVFGGMAILTFVFYVIPRMESPIPRGFRRGRA